MADWSIQIRTPGPGGAWTTVGLFMDLWYRLEINALPQINFNVPNPGTSLAALLVIGNEVRVLDPGSVERVRGMIREATNDPILKIQKVTAVGKAVRLQDRIWQSRRNFPNVSPSVVFDELMNSPEGEPSAGLILRYDMESLTSTGLLDDFSVNSLNGTFNGAVVSVTGKWGLGYSLPTSTTSITAGTSAILNLGAQFTIGAFITTVVNGDGEIAVKGHGATTISGYEFKEFHGTPGNDTLKLYTGNGTTQGIATFTGTFPSPPFHVAAVVNGTSCTFYINGAVAATGSAVTPSGNGTDVFTIGGLNVQPLTGGSITGLMVDELHIYSRVLSINEIKQLAGTGVLEGGLGTIDTALPTAPPRAEGDKRLQVIDSYCRALGAEWFIDQNASDQDRLNVVSRIGSSTSTQTFQLSKNCSIGNRQLNNDTIFNDITVYGFGDGPQQLQSRNFSATTFRTTLTASVTATQTTAISVVSTAGWPTSGVIYIGMERLQYSGITATTIGSTTLVRAYQGDGIASYPAYAHNSGLEVYVSFDGTNYWTSTNAQTNSQISINGLRNGNYTDKTQKDQNTLDFLAFQWNVKYNNPREALQITFPASTLTAVLGDAITINDSAGNPFASTPYRIIAYEFDWDSRIFRLELLPNSIPHASGGYIDSPSRRMAGVQESASDLETYGIVGSYPYSNFIGTSQSIVGATETVVNNIILQGIKNGTKLVFFCFTDDVAGTGTTQFSIRLRQGAGITGLTLASSNHTITGGATSDMSLIATAFAYQDNPLYTITMQQTSATGNGTVFDSSVVIFVTN